MKSNYKRLGDYIHKVDERNKEYNTNLQGLSMTKEYRSSTSNIVGTDLSSYKVMRKNRFVCDFMSVIRVYKLPVVLHKSDDIAIVSPAYTTFEVNDISVLLPDYLMLWFRRSEFDRYAFFKCDSAIRGGFDWEALCDCLLPIPEIDEQERIVNAYNTIERRIELKRKINENLEEQAQSIFIKLFAKNTQYENWYSCSIEDLVDIIDNRGKTPQFSKQKTVFPLIEIGAIHSFGRVIDYNNVEKFVSQTTYNNWFRSGHPTNYDTLMSTVGSLAELKLFIGHIGCIAQNLIAFHCKEEIFALYLYQYLVWKRMDLLSYEIGSVQASIKVSQVIKYIIKVPPMELLNQFNKVANPLTMSIYNNTMETLKLLDVQSIILSTMSC